MDIILFIGEGISFGMAAFIIYMGTKSRAATIGAKPYRNRNY